MLYHPEIPISARGPLGPRADIGRDFDTDFVMFYTLYHMFKQESRGAIKDSHAIKGAMR